MQLTGKAKTIDFLRAALADYADRYCHDGSPKLNQQAREADALLRELFAAEGGTP